MIDGIVLALILLAGVALDLWFLSRKRREAPPPDTPTGEPPR